MQIERLKILKELLEADPTDAFNWYAVAMEYRQQAPQEALPYLEHLAEHFPEYLPTYYQLATLYAEQNCQTEATEVFGRGIELAQRLNNQKTLKELQGALAMYRDEWEEF